jgi:hypothetical protein
MLENYSKGKFIKPKGFFVEAGAGDGEIISNSLYFELKYGVNTILCYLIKSLNVSYETLFYKRKCFINHLFLFP